MPIDFPNTPSLNDEHTVGGVTWKYNGYAWDVVSGGSGFRVSGTAPTSPATGDLWYDTESGEVYIYYDGQWVSPAVPATIPAAPATTITGTNAEGSSGNFARADHDHALSASLVVPVGSVMPYAGTSAPTSWLLCDGSEKAVATYPALDLVLGTTYGTRTNGSGGAGTSHFRLPDLRGRVVAGLDNMGGSAASRLTSTVLSASNTVGATGGSQTHTLTGAESGTSAHNHSGTTGGGNSKFYRTVGAIGTDTYYNHVAGWGGGGYVDRTDANWPNSDHSHDFTTANSTAANASSSHTNTQPSIVMNYIIKA